MSIIARMDFRQMDTSARQWSVSRCLPSVSHNGRIKAKAAVGLIRLRMGWASPTRA
jgi:hypothetical protein